MLADAKAFYEEAEVRAFRVKAAEARKNKRK